MALNKNSLNVNFAQGLDTKTDPFQLQPGKFLSLENSIFDKAGRLTKRNGFGPLTMLPDESSKTLTTFNGDLTAIGSTLEAYSSANKTWFSKGNLTPVKLDTLTTIRSNTNQSQADSVVALNGLMCTVFTDNVPSGSSNVAVYKYVVSDSITGQNIIAPQAIPVVDGAINNSPRVFILGAYFIIVSQNLLAGTTRLQYMAVSTQNPTLVTPQVNLAASITPASNLNWDCVVLNTRMYVAYNTVAGGQSVKLTYLTNTGTIGTPITFAGQIATHMAMTADFTTPTNPTVWASYYDSVSTNGFTLATNVNLGVILSPTMTINGESVNNITASTQSGNLKVVYEINEVYGYDSGLPTNRIGYITVTPAGSVPSAGSVIRSVGLASKSFVLNNQIYFLAIYNTEFQPTYFLVNILGEIIAKLAYANAPSAYYDKGLPNALSMNSIVSIAYLFKDLVQAVNKTQGVTSASGVYAQTGINLVSFDFSDIKTLTAEIGANLNLTGGFLAAYDGYAIVEQEFFLYPDSVELSGTTGGSMSAQQYFYQVTYEWSDNQGNLFRSAPSIPVTATLAGMDNAIVVFVPTLRLTYKTQNPVKIVIYRWSTAQQVYYQVTSILVPVLNDTTTDSISYTDKLADSSIIGNNILYTTGGVLENIAPPATDIISLFNNRLWLVDAEDRNLLWFSKQVIEATPVEMSDLLTIFVAPTTGAQGSTGDITALSPMDDKLIVFKPNALGYINGIGPDNTGNNNQYSDFTLINSVVGCENQQSIVFMPRGLMFQSNKGIWLLGRDLSTEYIGAPVESLTTGATVLSAINVPATNQVRFTLDTGITLMYDYYYGQWGTFTKIPAISSTVYTGLHTYLNDLGRVFQETPSIYLDNSSPVLMSFTTGWINIAGVQGFERFYQMYLLGEYLSPFKLNTQLAFDYNPSLQQATIVTPTNPGGPWGSEQLWGSGGLWGGQPKVFEARVFPRIQKCESFQVSINEIFDSTIGVAAGAGLTLSGLNLVIGTKKSYRTSTSAKSFG